MGGAGLGVAGRGVCRRSGTRRVRKGAVLLKGRPLSLGVPL